MIDSNILSLLRRARSRLARSRPILRADQVLVVEINRFITAALGRRLTL
ncbi:hypothetical protein [Sphingobium lactosutens]|nr:hypothetical protein [Sphingobium lactosutens]